MGYERMTLSSFLESLKSKKYDTATGARRAVGKSDWGAHDKKMAAEAINDHFGADSVKTAAVKKTAKKTSKKAAKPVARAAKKTSAVAAAAPAPPVAKRPYTKRTPTPPVNETASPGKVAGLTSVVKERSAKHVGSAEHLLLPVHAVAPSLIGEAVIRQKNASDVISALASLQQRSPEEGRCYMAAVAAATRSFETDASPPPRVLPAALTLVAPSPAAPTLPSPSSVLVPGSTANQSALDHADNAARALVGSSYGTGGNAVGAPAVPAPAG